jgi:hypothetical protein
MLEGRTPSYAVEDRPMPTPRGSAEEMHHLHGLPKDEYVRRGKVLQERAHFESLTADRTRNKNNEDVITAQHIRIFANEAAKILVEMKDSPYEWCWPEQLMRIEYWSNLAAEYGYMIKRRHDLG